jgi:hypothetical protein
MPYVCLNVASNVGNRAGEEDVSMHLPSRALLRCFVGCAAFVCSLLFTAPDTRAQSAFSGAIAGIAKDTSGAVLPGVSVDVESPALIERIRTAITDARGQYKITELPPGVFTVTFRLAGFSTIKREGITLTTGFTATINADMAVGSLQETITVSGTSPIIDTQSTRQTRVLTREVLDTIPVTKTQQGFAAITLGGVVPLNRHDVGGSTGELTTGITYHGVTDSLIYVDGAPIMSVNGAGTARYFRPNEASAEEVNVQISNASAESEAGGVVTNYVPKDGGNTFKFTSMGNYTSQHFQGSNLTDAIHQANPTLRSYKADKIYDSSASLGGPIIKDRLWFHATLRKWASDSVLPDNFLNLTPHSPVYTPDLNSPAVENNGTTDATERLSWQLNSNHRLSFLDMYQRGCACPYNLNGTMNAYDAAPNLNYYQGVVQAGWNYVASNRLLFEARVSHYYISNPVTAGPGVAPTDIAITETTTGVQYNAYASSSITGYSLYPNGSTFATETHNVVSRGSASYVTGSHAFKVGFSTLAGVISSSSNINEGLTYTFTNSRPVALTMWATPNLYQSNTRLDLGIYGQDVWTIRRMTLNLGVRYDYLNSYVPAQLRPAGYWTSATQFNEIDKLPLWQDITPRLGLSYDVFGSAKTVVKFNTGKYMALELTTLANLANPAGNIAISNIRTWRDANGNFVPDCDLMNPVANGECGASSNLTFGTPVITQRIDDSLRDGWGIRPYIWQTSASVQQQIRPGLAINVGYSRNTWGNLRVTKNDAVTPGDYNPYCLTVPTDPRLPSSAQQLCGLYDVQPAFFGLTNNVVRLANNYGNEKQYFNGVDIGMNGRLGNGIIINGGVATGQMVTDTCFTVDSPMMVNADGSVHSANFCHVVQPWSALTQIKINGAVPLPIWKTQAAITFQNIAGPPLNASYVATNAQIAPSLGRSLGQCRGSTICNGVVTIDNLFTPNSLYGDRVNQLDIRLDRLFALGHTRLIGKFDVYNVFNNSSTLSVNTRYSGNGSSWLTPLSIQGPRTFKFGAQFDF